MICPRCSVAEISPLTNRCELCGYSPSGGVAVEAPAPDATDELARRELGHLFQIDVLLGMGAGSAVYLARELGTASHLVLKAVRRPADQPQQADERFRRAVETTTTFDHPHIVPVTRHGTTSSLLWYAMEHVRARSLRLILATRGPLDVKSCQRVAAQVASALDYIHRRGAVHGDVKPENVLIDADGWVHMCDALLARSCRAQAPHTPPESSRPAPRQSYLAPEDLLEGLCTPASDQYALAVLVQECLTASPPVERDPVTLAPTPSLDVVRPDLPIHIAHSVRRALAAKPADRFPSVLDFLAALEEPGRASLPSARPTGRASATVLTIPDWQPPPDEGRRRLLKPLAIAAGVIVAALVLRGAFSRLARHELYDATPPTPRSAPRQSADSGAATADTARGQAPATDRLRVQLTPPPEAAPPAEPRPSRRTTQPPTQTAEPAPSQPAVEQPTVPAPPPRRAERAAPPAAAGQETGAASEQGHLFVNATPWGQLYVDGQLVGNTPKANLAVAPGNHTIRVVREGYEPFERSVQVAPGQVVRITDIVLTERRP